LKSELPIVPVGLRGTFEVQSPKSFAIRPRRIVVHYGTPISTSGLEISAKRRLVAEVRERVGELTGLEFNDESAAIASPNGK
jgi:1-acyl-sn-glycerol-3-phosphate acyltransferase